MENCRQPFCALLKRKQAERSAGILDALLGAAYPLRHGRLGDQKGLGNLRRSQTADGPQRQSNCRGRTQGGMAAHKQQNQRVIWVHVILNIVDGRKGLRIPRDRGFPLTTCNFTAYLIGQPAGCHPNQPAAWIVGNTLVRPLRERCQHGLLNGIFGCGEIAKSAHNSSKHLRSEFAQQTLGLRIWQGLFHGSSSAFPLMTCRTSIGIFKGSAPGPGAADQIAAIL